MKPKHRGGYTPEHANLCERALVSGNWRWMDADEGNPVLIRTVFDVNALIARLEFGLPKPPDASEVVAPFHPLLELVPAYQGTLRSPFAARTMRRAWHRLRIQERAAPFVQFVEHTLRTIWGR